MISFDDDDARYKPKQRENGYWSVWDKALKAWVTDANLSTEEAWYQAAGENASMWAADDATWD